MRIKDINQDGQQIAGKYTIHNATYNTTKNGNLYLSCTLSDNTGTLQAKAWGVTDEQREYLDGIIEDGIISLDGKVQKYNDQFQIIIGDFSKVENLSPMELKMYLPESMIIKDNQKELFTELVSYAKRIENKGIQNFVAYTLKENQEDYMNCPAALNVHHDKVGGLLIHTVEVLRILDKLSEIYPEVNTDILFAGAILHDFGKIYEMKRSKLGLVTNYSKSGVLLGHISIGTEYIHNKGREFDISYDDLLVLEHMVLSHHGEKDFGSPKFPACVEAFLLHQADKISCFHDMYAKATEGLESGEMTEAKQFLLGNQPILKI